MNSSKRGYFPMFVDLSEKKAVVIGAGAIAGRRISTLTEFMDDITVVAPEIGEQVLQLELEEQVTVIRRMYRQDDLEGADLVVAGTDDHQLNAEIAGFCQKQGILVNVTTDRTLCDFYFPGIVRRDNLVVGVNAGGINHRQVKTVRHEIETILDGLEEKDGE